MLDNGMLIWKLVSFSLASAGGIQVVVSGCLD